MCIFADEKQIDCMTERIYLAVGMQAAGGKCTIVDEDRLCYLVQSTSNNATGLRTISKTLVLEFISYFKAHPSASSTEARNALSGLTDIDKFEYGYNATLKALAELSIYNEKNHPDKFTQVATQKIKRSTPLPLQRIFYGAPGTGKSHEVKVLTAGRKVIRTTFHPDSDYSTFVGAYKPTMTNGKWEERILTVEELIAKLKEIKNDGEPRYAHRFGAKYSKTLKSLGSDVRKGIVLSSGCTEATDQEVTKGMEVGEYLKKIFSKDSKIVYTFVAQSFLQAYVEAWRRRASEAEDEDVFLVIEEINRGNCAQIFGDLFQLLDRGDDGFSEYPIEADADMRKYLSKALNGLSSDSLEESLSEDRAARVLSGEELLLPDNLYIWATMNTSDQSLFPIDSAFKRRWDWAYVPIEEGKKEGQPLGWQIAVGDKRYDWWLFLQAINNKIGEATNSEDKKLGYFFCKAKEGTISAETFVAKVLFYLWNDVFKDYETEATIFTDAEGKAMPFHCFYSAFGKVNEEAITTLLNNLGVEAIATPQDEPQDEPQTEE